MTGENRSAGGTILTVENRSTGGMILTGENRSTGGMILTGENSSTGGMIPTGENSSTVLFHGQNVTHFGHGIIQCSPTFTSIQDLFQPNS